MQSRANEYQLWKSVWHAHIKYQMLPRGSDLIMIIGSKLQNKCAEFKKRPSPASSVNVMTLLHTPQAHCDIHTNQTQSAMKMLSYAVLLSFSHFFAFLICIISRSFRRTFCNNVHIMGNIFSPHKKEIISENMDILFFYCISIKWKERLNSLSKQMCKVVGRAISRRCQIV